MSYVGLKVPVGRIHADKLQDIALIAEKYGNGEIRFSHSNSLIIPNVPDQKLGGLLQEPLVKEFTYHPSSIMKGLVSCVGIDYCHLATIETKSRALQVAKELEDKLPDTESINMHWSGCPAGCGNHLVADIGVLGKKIKSKIIKIEVEEKPTGEISAGNDPRDWARHDRRLWPVRRPPFAASTGATTFQDKLCGGRIRRRTGPWAR